MPASLSQPINSRHSALFWMVMLGLSMGLHALLLWLWPGSQPNTLTLNLGQTPVQVSYHESSHAPAAAASRPSAASNRHKQKPAKTTKPAPRPNQNTQPAQLTTRQSTRIVATERQSRAPATSTPAPQPAQQREHNTTSQASSLSLSQKQDRARKLIRELLTIHYPRLAINQGWEGDVGLSVTIRANGRLDKVLLTRSSGYNVLDRAAMRSMQSIRLLPGSQVWLQRKPLTLSYNVVYKLIEE